MIRHSLDGHSWEMQEFIDPSLLNRLRVGPLAAYLDTYLERIKHAGFLPSSVPMQMYAIARFSNWLHSQQINLQLMDEGTVQQFLKRDVDISHSGESGSLHRLLTMLREIGVTAAKPVQIKDGLEQLTGEYKHYLLHERGLAQSSLLNYVPFAEQFLTHRFGREEMTISSLTAKDVTKFIRDRVRQMSPGRAKSLVAALRSFLRYLRHQDRISVDLAECVPPVACWSLSTVPKFLPAGTVQRVLSQCERKTADGNGITLFC